MILSSKRGQFQSLMLGVLLLVGFGFVAFTFGDLIFRLFDGMDTALTNTNLNGTVQHQAVEEFAEFNRTAWDQITIVIMVAILLSLIFTAYLTRVSPAFYWIYIIFSIFIVMLGSMFSSFWDTMTAQDIYSTTINNYPMTDAIFGNNFVFIILSLFIILLIIFIFGKGGENATR